MAALAWEMTMSSGRPGDARPRTSSLGRIKRLREIQNENIEAHAREPKRAKITESGPHPHLVTRTDTHMDERVLGATKRDLPRMQWLVFVAMEFGWVEDARGILRAHPGKREPVERDLTFEEVALQYGLSTGTVRQYDKLARGMVRRHRAQADYLESRYGPEWEAPLPSLRR